jgi:hypothetical protein
MARWTTDVLAEKYAREAHEKLMERFRERSPDWRLSPKATAVVLDIIGREARKRLVFEPPEEMEKRLQRELDEAGFDPDKIREEWQGDPDPDPEE